MKIFPQTGREWIRLFLVILILFMMVCAGIVVFVERQSLMLDAIEEGGIEPFVQTGSIM